MYLQKNIIQMNTTSSVRNFSHRKLIDIPEDVFRTLTVKAATMGTSLKKLIEEILVREAEDMDDAELYKYLVATRRDGKEMLSDTEQDAFERKMGLGKYG